MPRNKKNTTLKQLYNNTPLFTKVTALIEDKQTFDYIMDFVAEMGHPMSRGTLANLKAKYKESKDTGVPIGDLIDRRSKTSVTQVQDKLTGYTGEVTNKDDMVQPVSLNEASKTWWSTKEVLSEIIAKGKQTLDTIPVIDLPQLMKAIDLYQRNFGSETDGLSIAALKQYDLITRAKLKAMSDVVMEYVPEDKQEDAYKEMSQAEHEVLANMDVPDELIKTFKDKGLNI